VLVSYDVFTMKQVLKNVISIMGALVLVMLPTVTQAAGFVTCSGTDCSVCNLVDMANTIILWLIALLFMIFAILLFIAGWGLITSAGNVSAKEEAKSKITNAVIGILIVLAAWLIVDTFVRALVGDSGQINGVLWTDIQCHEQAEAEFEGYEEYFAGGSTILNDGGTPDDPSDDTVAPGTGDVPADPSADGSFSYNGGIAAQRAHASPALESMLTCMANTVPGDVGRISSISDGLIVSGSKTWAQCAAGQCQHSRGSYHYGGSGACVGKSYAVDFGDEENNAVLCAAARSCGSVQSCSVHNGNHTHLSVAIPPGC
jgi:hypothetical protein